MPRPACAECCVEMKMGPIGVDVELTANFGSYQVWNADIWSCPKCGHRSIFGYGSKPIMQHHEEDYKERLERMPNRITLTNTV